MTRSSLARHFEAIRSIDARAEIEEKRIRQRLAMQERQFKANHWEPARRAAKAIEKAIRKRLAGRLLDGHRHDAMPEVRD